jgi:PAS domain S-box-containing protein
MHETLAADGWSAVLDDEWKQEALFHAIANFTYDWESWIDPQGRPQWVNPAVERITGYSPEDCLAMRDYPLRLVDPADRRSMARHLANAAAGGVGNEVEFRIRRKDGGLRWGSISWQSLLGPNGRCLGYRTSVRDITERKQAERLLRLAREEAEEEAAIKSMLLASASHDLRQPLQALRLLMAAFKAAPDGPMRTRILDAMGASLDGATELVDALCESAQLESGILYPRVESFAVGEVLGRLETAFAPFARNKRLSLRVVPSGAVVRSDPLLLDRILRNLLCNALRYTDAGRVLVGCRRRGERLWVEVWDTGIGIPDDKIAVVFDDFTCVSDREREGVRGLGLGLAIVRRLCRLLGHTVTVDSREGSGSCFAIALPLATAGRAPLGGVDTPPPGALSGLRVLLLDGEPLRLAAMRTLMRQWGCEVTTAATCDDALTRLADAQHSPAVIVADHCLRYGTSGLEAIERVRTALGLRIPALVLRGSVARRLGRPALAGTALVLPRLPTAEEVYQALCALTGPGSRPPRRDGVRERPGGRRYEGSDAFDFVI